MKTLAMPDVGTPVPRSVRPSHTATEQWQSFEIKMRYRRAQRCVSRAEAALAAGREDEAHDALTEARALTPQAPSFDELVAGLREREAATAAAKRSRRRRAAAAAAGLILFMSAGGWAWWLQTSSDGTEENAAVAAPTRVPSRPTSPASSAKLPQSANDRAPVPTAAQPSPPPPATESPVRTSGSAPPTTEAPAPAPEPAPLPDGPPLPVVQDVNPSLTLERPTTAETTESAITRVTGPDGLVANLPSAALPVVTIPPSPPPPAAESKPVEPPVESEEPKVRAVLAQFEAAYSNLSASSAQAVWPTVDVRALASAFDSLQSQQVSLGRCSIAIEERSARAACSGTTSWTPKVGGGRRTAARRWEIDLASENGAWHILQATAR